MKKAKLYLICPDCHIEHALRNAFGEDAYFLTALGSVFDFSDFAYAEELNHLVHQEMISEIVIVNDTNCTFIKNTVLKEKNYSTKVEKELGKLQENNSEQFALLKAERQKELLAKLNIYRQAYELLDVAFIGGKIENGVTSISGLIYDRGSSKFERLMLKL